MPTINGVYYDPGDPHVPTSMGGTNPNPTEVLQASGGDSSGGGGGGGGGGFTIQNPTNGINGPLPGDPNPVTGYGSPGSFPAGSVGGTSANPITFTQPTQLTTSQIQQMLYPPGSQAPVDQWNADMGTGQLYPPGQAAPANGYQLSSDIFGPTALAMAAMVGTPPPAGQFNSDYYVGADPEGGYDEVFQGQKKKYATQNQAEQAYNTDMGFSNAAPAAAAGASTGKTGVEFDANTPFWAGPDAGFVTRTDAINRLAGASGFGSGYYQGYTNSQLAQAMTNAYTTGQQQLQAQRLEQQQNFTNNLATEKQQQGELDSLVTLLRSAPAMAPQLVPQINALLQALGLPLLPPNEAQLLMASLAGSSLGGGSAPTRITFAPLGG